ncbi:GlxA family transcriptional regulator [Umezawaea sp.]|uniref:GlxA family transcriptional regulator n=1 Tax=Umezawaea sp. TaxID=1955258 RepID=UPI002ED49A58
MFLLPQALSLLDLAGPVAVYRAAVARGLPYRLSFVADGPDLVTAEGLGLRAGATWPDLSPADLVFVPGGGSVSAASLAVLRRHHATGGTVVAVGTGADSLGRAGLLDGRRATTHHGHGRVLADATPAATVVDDVLHVVDGRIATSAGGASGLDVALHLLAASRGPGVAARVARDLLVYPRGAGDEPPPGVPLRHRAHVDDLTHRLQDLIEDRFTERLRLVDMSRELGFSERTLTRHFRRATGLTPLRYQQLLRVERAEQLIGRGATVDAAARAVGLTDARALRALRA